ncbi:protein NLRC3-like [Poecilia formosa]|uniref:protein NLRC3-like n=1 Tax=Poecilia formosa TaxID=48698 RepID=UPI0007B812D0|nr:PREDICTED: protein NLRC3-like [Poecilia formosa]
MDSKTSEDHRPASPTPTSISMRSECSRDLDVKFKGGGTRMSEDDRPASPTPTSISMRSDHSGFYDINFKEETSPPQTHKSVTSVSVTKPSEDELLSIKRDTGPKQQLCETWRNCILSVTLSELTDVEFDSELFEITKNRKYMDKMVETYSDLFITPKRNDRTVLTQGVAGIGKTYHTRKLMVDWAKQKSNTHIDLMVPLRFAELNAGLRAEAQSIADLLDSFLSETKQPQVSTYEECKVAFILDGLENCQLPLNFKKNKKLTKITERAAVDVLLTNLIKGNLLPNAVLWIISQPSGVKKIPAKYINKVLVCKAQTHGDREKWDLGCI